MLTQIAPVRTTPNGHYQLDMSYPNFKSEAAGEQGFPTPPMPRPLAGRRCYSLSSSLVVPPDAAPIPLWPSETDSVKRAPPGDQLHVADKDGANFRLGMPLARLLSKSTHDIDHRFVVLRGLGNTDKDGSRGRVAPSGVAKQPGELTGKTLSNDSEAAASRRIQTQQSLESIQRQEAEERDSRSQRGVCPTVPSTCVTVRPQQGSAVCARLGQPLAKSLSKATYDLRSSSSPETSPTRISPSVTPPPIKSRHVTTTGERANGDCRRSTEKPRRVSSISASSLSSLIQTTTISDHGSVDKVHHTSPSLQSRHTASESTPRILFGRSRRSSSFSSGDEPDQSTAHAHTSHGPFHLPSAGPMTRTRRNTFSEIDLAHHRRMSRPRSGSSSGRLGEHVRQHSSAGGESEVTAGGENVLIALPDNSRGTARSSSDSLTRGESIERRRQLQRIKSAPVLRLRK